MPQLLNESRVTSKGVARPAKHTRQTYIHEAFPWLLYQTRQGVICFAPFQQPISEAPFCYQSLSTPLLTRRHTSAQEQLHAAPAL
jgi:hypothetical protein